MKILPLFLLAASAFVHANSRPCAIDGWLKIRPLPNAAGDAYGEPDWPEKIPLFPTADSRTPDAILPDALQGATWDYLSVNFLGFAENGRFRVNIKAYGADPESAQPVTGWLDAQHIGFGLQSSRLYAKPDAQSERLLDVQGEWLHEIGDITRRLAHDNIIDRASAQQAALLWAFGHLTGNSDMHGGNLSFINEQGLPLRLAPVYDMTAMAFAPRSGGGLPEQLPAPDLRADIPAVQWRQAIELANEWFGRVQNEPRFSPRFAPCIAALRNHLDNAAMQVARLAT